MMYARETFIAEALASDTDDCILWPFAVRASSGYGAHTTPRPEKRNVDVHRYVCERAHGRPLPGQQALHSCDTRLCCNKRHLSWGTHGENMAEMVARGRTVGGGRGRQRLFAKQRAAIAASSMGLVALGRQYGMEPSHIAKVRREACHAG